MYLGHLVELGTTEEILKNPAHPYTKALFDVNAGVLLVRFQAHPIHRQDAHFILDVCTAQKDAKQKCRRCRHFQGKVKCAHCGMSQDWGQFMKTKFIRA